MRPRTILYTGKGGVGKTSVAACTARRCAADGLRTLVLSTDPAHSLSESFDAEIGAEPTALDSRLWAQEVHAQDEMERHWSGVQEWLGELLLGHRVHDLFLLLGGAGAVLAVAEDPELAGHPSVGLEHDSRKELLALLEPEAVNVEVGHPDAPGVVVGVLPIVGGHSLGHALE